MHKMSLASLEARKAALIATNDPDQNKNRVEHRQPAKVRQAMELLAQQTPFTHIARKTGLAATTIARLQREHAEAFQKSREYHARNVASVSDATLELLKERINAIVSDPEAFANTKTKELLELFVNLEQRREALTASIPVDDSDDVRSPEEIQEEIDKLAKLKQKGSITMPT